MATWINEFPHRTAQLHWHPTGGDHFSLDLVTEALEKGISSIELDMHLVGGEIRINHDPPSSSHPTLSAVIGRILGWKGSRRTVQTDGKHFFVWIDAKGSGDAFADAVYRSFDAHVGALATAVGQSDRGKAYARPLTVIVTGGHKDMISRLRGMYGDDAVNRRFLYEGGDYTGAIIDLSAHRTPFQWKNYKYPDFEGKVNDDHRARFNVRAWDTGDSVERMSVALRAGCDTVNVNRNKLGDCRQLFASQKPRGRSVGLAIDGNAAVMTWRGESSDNLYLAQRSYDAGARRLVFERQICLSTLLADKPLSLGPAVDFADGAISIVSEGTGGSRLWNVTGCLREAVTRVYFDGKETRLLGAGDSNVLGHDPSSTLRGSQALSVYRGTANQRLFAALWTRGQTPGTEVRITTSDEKRRGYHPRTAFVGDRLFVVYEGTSDQKLYAITANVAGSSLTQITERCLTVGSSRRGRNPAVAVSPTGQVLIVYEGTDGDEIFYLSGRLDASGAFVGEEHRLTTADGRRRGHRPDVAFAANGAAVIVYQGTSGAKIFYVAGPLAGDGSVVGDERLLDMGLHDYA